MPEDGGSIARSAAVPDEPRHAVNAVQGQLCTLAALPRRCSPGGAGLWVQDEVAAVDAGERTIGSRQLAGGFPVDQVGAERRVNSPGWPLQPSKKGRVGGSAGNRRTGQAGGRFRHVARFGQVPGAEVKFDGGKGWASPDGRGGVAAEGPAVARKAPGSPGIRAVIAALTGSLCGDSMLRPWSGA